MSGWDAGVWAAIIAAPFVGSFLGVLATRLPEGGDVVRLRSHCQACGRTLTAAELVPLASFVVQRGRCKNCGARMSFLYPGIELAALVVAVWAALETSGAVFWISLALGWTLLTLTAMDLRSLVLSDVLTLPLIAAGLAAAYWLSPADLPWHVAAAGLGFGFIVATGWVYRRIRGREGIGMGDAKLLAAAGAWTGIGGAASTLLLGVMLALVWVLVKSGGKGRLDGGSEAPLGAGLAPALWLVWLYGPLAPA